MMGSHLVKHWSTTQRVVTLSSGEAELAGIVKGAAEALGLRSLSADFGETSKIKMYADASAAIGICRRSDIGKVRHLVVGQLWVQERVRTGDLELYKILGTVNPADALTKHLPREMADRHLQTMSVMRVGGRASSAPHVI